AAVGCGGEGSAPAPDRIPVSGIVMYKNAPVEGAVVTFYNEKAPRNASGTTDKEGKFTLTMIDPNDGAVAGTNIITVTKTDTAAAPAVTGGPPSPEDLAKKMAEMKMGDPKAKKATGSLPAKYASQTSTPLKEDVSASNNQFTLQLTD
ncbi:MAG: hypothetical protein RL215_2693, partial [Planctomycetota bacterium]